MPFSKQSRPTQNSRGRSSTGVFLQICQQYPTQQGMHIEALVCMNGQLTLTGSRNQLVVLQKTQPGAAEQIHQRRRRLIAVWDIC